ncbi:hypothetical protein K7W42_20500 [Deinococcus sp. HMF7604]|uniref:hypothetical protein n=1 Tax=Deinococcus betulae TaxID=2873312 RepID=UPI001CCFCCE5|nr:hypothetical protein [Deinococcus betulae]MBZ9753221.1 hypothetical protein [Deinococcus betulae]
MTQPAEFDKALVHLPWREACERWVNQPARYALAALGSFDSAVIQKALDGLNGYSDPLSNGARLMCQVQLGQYAVVENGTIPQAETLEEVEGALYTLLAQSVVATEAVQLEQATSRLYAAGVLARLLGMRHKQQWIELERQRMLIPQGLANPDAVRAAVALAPASQGRLAWARDIEGGALLSRGAYAVAALTASGGVRALGLALGGIFLADMEPDGGNFSLALAIKALKEGANVSELVAELQWLGDYPDLLRNLERLRDGQEINLTRVPRLADQQMIWALTAWEALARGDKRQSPAVIVATLKESLERLDSPDVFEFVALYAPATVAALCVSPLANSLIPDSPLLLGEHLAWHGDQIKLPGRTGGGQALLMNDLGQDWEVTRVERQRMRRAIERLQLPRQMVYATQVARALYVLIPGGGSAWSEALQRVTFRVDSRAVRKELSVQYGISLLRQA